MATIVPPETDLGAAPGFPTSTIAEAMPELIQDKRYPGGNVMKIRMTEKACCL